jgi:hypothetical protein
MKLLRDSRCLVVLLASLASACASADPGSAEQLVKRLYAVNSRQFDRGEFAGKYDPQRHCKLYRDFFAEPMIKLAPPGCTLAGSAYGRFAVVDAENISQTGDELPKVSVKSALAHDDVETAVPVLFSDDTRIVYFVKGTQGAARIVNMLISDKWPDQPNEEEASHLRCPFEYALPANRFEVSTISASCRARVNNAN